MVKRIVFEHQYGHGLGNTSKEVFEFDDYVTDEEIEQEYVGWMISLVADSCTWYEE